jgi:uncharacterized cupredoxin-like copper-binding protein
VIDRRKSWLVMATAVTLGLATTACSSGDSTSGDGSTSAAPASSEAETAGTAVPATESDFKIVLGEPEGSAGATTFQIQNDGPSTHEFVVFKTDLAPDSLPTDKDGNVEEDGKGVEHLDEVEDIAAGSDAELELDLEAGSYVVICNLPGHYKLGMDAGYTAT